MENTKYRTNNNVVTIIKTKTLKTKYIIKIKVMNIKEFRNNTISENEKKYIKKNKKYNKKKKKYKMEK